MHCNLQCIDVEVEVDLKIVDRLVGSVVSTSRQVLRGLRRLWGSPVMTGFTLSRHLGNNNAPLSAQGGS